MCVGGGGGDEGEVGETDPSLFVCLFFGFHEEQPDCL